MQGVCRLETAAASGARSSAVHCMRKTMVGYWLSPNMGKSGRQRKPDLSGWFLFDCGWIKIKEIRYYCKLSVVFECLLLKAPRIRKILFGSSFLRCLCVYPEARKNPAFHLWLPVCFRISNVSFLFSEDHKQYCCAYVLATIHRVSIEKCITCKSIEEHQNMAISAMYLLYFANTLRIWRKIGIRSALFSCFLF